MCAGKTPARPWEIAEEINSQLNLESGLGWVVVGEDAQPNPWGYGGGIAYLKKKTLTNTPGDCI